MNNNGLSKGKAEKKLSIFDFEVNQDSEIKELEPTLYIGGSLFGAKGELSFISGKAKAGKTSIATIIIASCLTQSPQFDSLSIESVFCENQPIIYIDTEQSKASSKKIVERVCKLLHTSKQPENLKIFNLRSTSIEDRKKYIQEMFETFTSPYLVFIDGLGDLVKSANDEKEANEIIQLFANYAEKYHTSIVLFLHETHTNEKMRGHLGSEAERKCFATISISKDRAKQIHSIKPKYFRDCKDFEDIIFRFDEEAKAMVSLKGSDYQNASKDENREQEFWHLGSLLKPDEKISSKELLNRVMNYTRLKERSSKDKIQKMVSIGVITKEEISKNEVYYFLSNSAL
jgi:hypothetical protein